MRALITTFFVMILFGIFGCGPNESEFISFGTYESPDKSHILQLHIARGRLAYSPVTLRVQIQTSGSEASTYEVTTKIANDGREITDDNIRVAWINPGTVRLCLSGAEQTDELLEIDIDQPSHDLKTAQCSK